MNEPNDARLHHAKIRFYDLCKMYNLDYNALMAISEISGVPKSVIDTMLVGTVVERADAEIVLAVLSQRTGKTYTLDNVDVPLLGVQS